MVTGAYDERAIPAAPEPVRELAEACVRFVERALGMKLDYEPETLSLLDHYLEESRLAVRERPETRAVLVQTIGAYFGEVVRRRHASWWSASGAAGDGAPFDELQFEDVYL